MRPTSFLLFVSLLGLSFTSELHPSFDVIIRQGMIYDGSGEAGFVADIAIQNDTIAAIGDLSERTAFHEIDGRGMAVAPGIINMLSWADKTLLMDGRSMSDIKQGVTLEVFGEGFSPGPVNRPNPHHIDSLWTTLGGYFKWLEKKGMSPNVASFVGATTIRMHELGQADRAPSHAEMHRMRLLVKNAMEEGAMGLGSSLIYAPANYAKTEELIELCKVVKSFDGMYITHMRSEGDFILDALEETLLIARQAKIPAEIYHLKVNLKRNWSKLDAVLTKIDSARNSGLKITANMYPYIASGTGLTARLPLWVQEGGGREMRKRLKDPSLRKKVLMEMEQGIPYKNSDASSVVLSGFRLDSLTALYKGKTLAQAAQAHGKTADETTLDLIVKDKSSVDAIYYLQSEENVVKIMKLPYVSFGSDAGSMAIGEMFEKWGAHPRAYGTFARVLGKYVRDQHVIPLEEAIMRMSALPASNLKIRDRGRLVPGYFADIIVFDPAKINDKATFENPHQYAEGMVHVFVNGRQVLRDGQHTSARPGRIIRGPGYRSR